MHLGVLVSAQTHANTCVMLELGRTSPITILAYHYFDILYIGEILETYTHKYMHIYV